MLIAQTIFPWFVCSYNATNSQQIITKPRFYFELSKYSTFVGAFQEGLYSLGFWLLFGSLCNQAGALVPIGMLHWENIQLPKTELQLNGLCVLPFCSVRQKDCGCKWILSNDQANLVLKKLQHTHTKGRYSQSLINLTWSSKDHASTQSQRSVWNINLKFSICCSAFFWG